MECCHFCWAPLEGSSRKPLCPSCVRSNQEVCKNRIKEKKAELKKLEEEGERLKGELKEKIEATRGEWKKASEENLNAAKWESLWATWRVAKETVDKEAREVQERRAQLEQRRAALAQAQEKLAEMKAKVEAHKAQQAQMAQIPQSPPSASTPSSTSIPPASSSSSTTPPSTHSSSSSHPASSSRSKQPSSRTTPHSSNPPSPRSHSSHPLPIAHASSHTSPSSLHHPVPSPRSHSSNPPSSHPPLSTSPSSHTHGSSRSHHTSPQPGSRPSSPRTSSSPRTQPHPPAQSTTQSHVSATSPPTTDDLQTIKHKLAQARRALIAELLSFFPINPSPTSSETETIILNVTMPNSGEYSYYRPDALSAALGYVAHVVYLVASYLGITLPWKVDFAGARSHIWDPYEDKRYPLFGEHYPEIEPGLLRLNRDIVYMCGIQGVHIPVSAQNSTLPNLLALLRSPNLGMPGPIDDVIKVAKATVARPTLRVKEPEEPKQQGEKEEKGNEKEKEKGNEKVKGKAKGIRVSDEDDFIVLDHPMVPTPEQHEELEHFERAMFIDTT